MKKLLYTIILFNAFLLLSCKKENTTWQTDWNIPLVHGKLTLDNLKTGNAFENTENFASVLFDDTLFSFKIDTLIKLPDTTLIQDAVISFPSLTLGPGNLIQNQNIDQLYDLGQIELSRVVVLEGTSVITISSPWPGKSRVVFEFPKTKDGNGVMFQKEYHLPAGTINNPSVYVDVIDMKNFDFDLTGSTGALYNNILANMYIYSDEETNTITITNQDTVRVTMEFKDMTAKYAKGYFGQYTISDTVSTDISQLKKIISGSITLDSLNINLSIRNGFKLTTQALLSQIKGLNSSNLSSVDLSFPQLNSTLNINPATGGYYSHINSIFNMPINSFNSNILQFIENLPDVIDVGFTIKINPYGNLNVGDDEFFEDSSLDLVMEGDFPLHFAMDKLTLVDTLDFSYDAPKKNGPSTALITLKYKNRFPFEAVANLMLLDANHNLLKKIDSESYIKSGTYNTSNNTTSLTEGEMLFTIDEPTMTYLNEAKFIALEIALSTDQQAMIKVNIDDYFDFNLFSDLNIKINY
jgi:hypothetical protein